MSLLNNFYEYYKRIYLYKKRKTRIKKYEPLNRIERSFWKLQFFREENLVDVQMASWQGCRKLAVTSVTNN